MSAIYNSLAGGLPAGFFLAICLYYIVRNYGKNKLFKVWHSILLTWITMSILIYLTPNYSESQYYQFTFTLLVIFGAISAFKVHRK